MKREIVASALSLGLAFNISACQENDSSEASSSSNIEVLSERHVALLGKYACDVEPATITTQDLAAKSLETFGDSSVGKAYTTAEGIVLDDSLSEAEKYSFIIHETLHWCADRANTHNVAPPLELPGIGELTGTDGFLPIVGGNRLQVNTFVEESAVEWLSIETGQYDFHAPEYAIGAEIIKQAADLRSFTAEDVLELLKKDDLLGFIGLLKDKPGEEVTGKDLNDIIYLLIDSYKHGVIPTTESLKDILDH